MISSSVHQRKSYTDMSRRGGLVDGEWVVVGWGWGGVYWNTYANGVHHDRTLHYRLYNGLVSDPPHTASRGSHVSNVRRCGRVSFFFFFSFPKVNLHSHLPFLIRPLSLWNVTWERKKREDRGEKQSITIIPSKKKNVPPSI